eukprot:6198498-Pleurochrysis_carterae.AAC.1
MRDWQCGIDALLNKIDGLCTKHHQSTWLPVAIFDLERDSTAVTKQLDLLDPSAVALCLEQVLEAGSSNFISPKSESFLCTELSSSMASIVEPVLNLLRQRLLPYSGSSGPHSGWPAEALRPMPNSSVSERYSTCGQAANVDRLPTLDDMRAETEGKNEIVSGLQAKKNAVDVYINAVKQAVQQCFLTASSTMRL